VQDPLPHIKNHNLSFFCPVNTEKLAVLDSAHQRKIGWETFYFSDEEAIQEFDENPLTYCGVLTDPITRQHFHPGVDSPFSDYEGRRYYFWTDSSKQMFDMMPNMYTAPNLTMEELNKQHGG
jgi:YHS domain-containing protein